MNESIVFSVAIQLGVFPAARSTGRKGRDLLDEALAGKKRVDLTVDFAGVSAMTFSFTDEFLGKFLSELDARGGELTVKVAGLDEENREAVAVCVERRGLSVALLRNDGGLELLGDSFLSATFDAALELGEFKALELATALETTAQNVNGRLKRLAATGAVGKTRSTDGTRGGKEFTYRAVPAEVPDTQLLAPA